MQRELLVFAAMVIVFMVCCFKFKLPVGIAMVCAAVSGTLVAGEGVPVRHLVEGSFGYIDTILVISTAMIFMKVVEASGALNALNTVIINRFYRVPGILLVFLMLVVMFPGMITGSSTAAVLTAGRLVAPVLIMMGIPRVKTAAIIAIGGMMGMVAPPVNVPVMIIGGGIDMPYVGFEIPLLLMSVPIAVFSVLFLGYKHAKTLNYELMKANLGMDLERRFGLKVYLPIIVVIVLMLSTKLLPQYVPNLGLPLIFTVGSLIGLFTGEKLNLLATGKEAVGAALPVMGILVGVGMFIQVMTLTGVRGLIVVSSLSLPTVLLYVGIAITIPLFGAISSYGSASVLGVPFVLALLSQNQIVTASALSLIASVGDLMPPTALAGMFAAQVVAIENYGSVLRKTVVPALVIIVSGVVFIVFSNTLASWIF